MLLYFIANMKKKEKKKKRLKDTNQATMVSEAGPRKFPFVGPMQDVSFMSTRRYPVHSHLLHRHEKLNAVRSTFSGLTDLSDVPDEAGYVLINYLYTGTYEFFPSQREQPKPLSAFEVSVHVYGLARKYEIPALAQLAWDDVKLLAAQHSPLKILETVKQAGQSFEGDDACLSQFIGTWSRQVLEYAQQVDLDVMCALICPVDTVSKIFMQEILFRCSSTADLTPVGSSLGDNEPLSNDSIAIDTADATPATATVAEEESAVIQDSPAVDRGLHKHEAFPPDEWHNPQRKLKKKSKERSAVFRDSALICTERVHHILGRDNNWKDCEVCRLEVKELASATAQAGV